VGKEGYGFVNFLRQNDLPSPEEVLEDFGKLPKREDALFVVLSSVAAYVVRVWTPEVWGAAWRLLEELVKRGQKDLAFNAAKALAKAQRAAPPQRKMPPPRQIDSFIGLMDAVEKYFTQ
jgi:hypothetical protein